MPDITEWPSDEQIAEQFTKQDMERFNRDLQRECRELWRNTYAAVLGAHMSPMSNVTGNWNIDSSGSMTDNSYSGSARHEQCAEAADVAVFNYKVMVANRTGSGSNPYVEDIPPTPAPNNAAPDDGGHGGTP